MTDDDLEPRLRRLLSSRVEHVDPVLSGADLRSRAGRSTALPRKAAPLLAAAVVAALALTTQLALGRHGGSTRPQQPGGASSTSIVSTPATPSPSPSAPSVSAPSTPISAAPTRPATPTPAAPTPRLAHSVVPGATPIHVTTRPRSSAVLPALTTSATEAPGTVRSTGPDAPVASPSAGAR